MSSAALVSMSRINEKKVEDSIIDILRKNGSIRGESAIRKQLGKKGIKVSFLRIRKISFHSKNITVEVKYGKGKISHKTNCPICGSKLETVTSMDLEGNRRVIGYKCQICHYDSISNGKPYLYIFRLRNYDF